MKCCTLATYSHMHRAVVMAQSWKKFYPEAQLLLCLVEQTDQLDPHTRAHFDHVVLAKDLGVPDFLTIMFGYQAGEATCSLKGELLLYMLRKFPEQSQFFYLDSDIKLYSRLVEAEDALLHHNLVINPHMLGFPPAEYIHFFGIYNTGFLAIRRSEQTIKFLDWWKSKLRFHCYIHAQRGVFLDQTWMNIAPSLVDTYVCSHPGYNVSFWNFHESARQFALVDSGVALASGVPMRFIHFSQLHQDFATIAKSKDRDPSGAIRHLYQSYVSELEQSGLLHMTNVPWTYSCYYDGSKIDSNTKEYFRIAAESKLPAGDPFLGTDRGKYMSEQRHASRSNTSPDCPDKQRIGGNGNIENPLVIKREAKGRNKIRRTKRKLRKLLPKFMLRKSRRMRVARKKIIKTKMRSQRIA